MNYNTANGFVPLNNNSVTVDFPTVDFAIDVFPGSDINIVEQVNADWESTEGVSEIKNKPHIPSVLYQPIAPSSPSNGDVWISSATLIQYQWEGAWISFNLQSLLNI